ncbi:unnamed protein product [Urochloa decumbens]|uniref:PGG domain-containing protein n=1 Tax=Urochloa decumbens TaxID=240449 RepID=A0ABC9D8L8_9POAL
MAAGNTNQSAAASAHSRPPSELVLDPQLLMAARGGDSKRLKELLRFKHEDSDEERHPAAASSEVVIVEVVPRQRHPAAPATAPPTPAPPPPPLDHGVTLEGDTLLHVVASCGDGEEFLHCAKTIIHDNKDLAAMRLLMEARNCKGDTALHCAAAAGNANMISCLVHLTDTGEAGAAKAFVRMQNERGETALHKAVRAPKNMQKASVDQLMRVDSELACIPCEGTSPLYLAISLGEMEIARHLFDASKGKLSYSGPDGQNVLHAAVSRGQALTMLLEWLRDVKTTADMLQEIQGERHMMASSSVAVTDLLSQLTNQRDRKGGSTPLHLAASLDGWPSAGFLSRWFPQLWAGSQSASMLLLDANLSTAYQGDDEGLYPIHVAAHAGSLDVVKMLLQRCPDCATLRDVKGRTFLHVAVEKGRHRVVKYVCNEPGLSSILNAQENNGDTALHSSVRAGNVAVFNCLLRNPQVRLDLANMDGMTPLDLSWSMIPSGFYYPLNPGRILRLSLEYAGAPHGGGRPELFYEKHIPKSDIDEVSKKHTEATQVMSIVTVLIATVTFASAFTLPGNYRGDGTPVLAGSYAFDAFILADTLAFICSSLATGTLVYAGLPAMDISIRHRYLNISASLLQSSTRSFVAAFALALYLVLAPLDRTTAVAICVIIFSSSLWGNMGAWRKTSVANTVRARIGIRGPAVWFYTRAIFPSVLRHFGSYIIIFGLPSIRKRAR